MGAKDVLGARLACDAVTDVEEMIAARVRHQKKAGSVAGPMQI